jgi:hypothetical protein
MKHTKTIEVKEEELVGFTCNCCGKEALRDDMCAWNDMNVLEVSGSYGSDYPDDLTSIEFEVCGKCLKSWVETFKHEPHEPEKKGYHF